MATPEVSSVDDMEYYERPCLSVMQCRQLKSLLRMYHDYYAAFVVADDIGVDNKREHLQNAYESLVHLQDGIKRIVFNG